MNAELRTGTQALSFVVPPSGGGVGLGGTREENGAGEGGFGMLPIQGSARLFARPRAALT